MSTSPREGRVRFPATLLDELEPVSAHRARDLVANNALHYADERCSHLVNWMAPSSSLLGGKTAYREPSPISTTWGRTAVWGPHRLTVDADGVPYTTRLRLFGASQSAGTAVEFALALAPRDFLEAGIDATGLTGFGCTFAATSSATPAWLTPAIGSDVFVPSFGLGARSQRRRAALTDTLGESCDVETREVFVVVYSKSASAVVAPRLYGVHVSQYVGS